MTYFYKKQNFVCRILFSVVHYSVQVRSMDCTLFTGSLAYHHTGLCKFLGSSYFEVDVSLGSAQPPGKELLSYVHIKVY
jgi:hypothetical protein